MSQTQQQFAYGKDTIQECKCPARAAGFAPSDGDQSTAVAEWYDTTVKDVGNTSYDSIISEQEAKEAWLEMIDQMEKRVDGIHKGERDLKIAREIAEELGWLA
jgi:hypothetical protein